ncbi:MAG TPA: protein-L-isoaspartate(D-aspartate) O-methyltransferase [Solirubrobacteraceae bacterium]
MHDAATLIAELRAYVADERVLEAIAAVPRERFVPAPLRDRAYENCALSIGCGQTISQPLVVARMTEMLAPRPSDRVLDVGTGSGYHAAVLAHLARHVWSIERHARLSRRAARSLREAGVDNVTLVVGDGTRGLPAAAPFDAVNVAAAGSAEALSELEDQLSIGGRLVAPVSGEQQRLVVTTRTAAGLERQLFEEVRFVPLVRDA